MEIEQFCILAKAQKGRACVALIQQVLNHKKIYSFGELLIVPSIAAVLHFKIWLHVTYFA